MSTNYFYKNMKSVSNFSSLSDINYFLEMPTDWLLIASDVKNSTINIENGKYKDINMIGAMCIVSILNLDRDIDLPYIFGGDGSFVLIPKKMQKKAKQAMLKIKELAKTTYGLDLRVGIIKLSKLSKLNKKILISKYQVTQGHYQALIKGDGLDYFDYLLKRDDSFHIKDKIDENFSLDLEGLECRWNMVKTPKDESLSFILKCFDENDYKDVLENIENIIGNIETRHPITQKNLKLSFKSRDLESEANLMATLMNSPKMKNFSLAKMKLINLIGYFLMKFNIGDWKIYKQRIVATTDIEKYDNTVRMIFSSSYDKIKKLEEYLEYEYQNGKLAFGIHKSKYALMTCLIFERHGKHIHFVDTTNGGYAMAAKEFKKRVEKLRYEQEKQNIPITGTYD